MQTRATAMRRDWALGAEEAREHFPNFFDAVDVYSVGASEEITGHQRNGVARRRHHWTKVFGAMGSRPNRRGLSRKHILEACDNSLRRLISTISTFVGSIIGVFCLQSKKLSMPSIPSCAPEKSVNWRQQQGGLAILQGALCGKVTWLAPVRRDAESHRCCLGNGGERHLSPLLGDPPESKNFRSSCSVGNQRGRRFSLSSPLLSNQEEFIWIYNRSSSTYRGQYQQCPIR